VESFSAEFGCFVADGGSAYIMMAPYLSMSIDIYIIYIYIYIYVIYIYIYHI
jgi:hypothetical protein